MIKNQNGSDLTTKITSGRETDDYQDEGEPEMYDIDSDFDCIKEELKDNLDILGDIKVQESGEMQDLLTFKDTLRIENLIKRYKHPVMVS